MPIFDPVAGRMVVRVVYDGLAFAGKTTNLRQLSALFAGHKDPEVISPAESNGRTVYFDLLRIHAGSVCGFPLTCQVTSVPGQVVLTPRRRHLLAAADVVVYVCESHEAAVTAAAAGLGLYDEVVATRREPLALVVQANKQDCFGALDGKRLLRALGREGVPVVEGIATEGVGVVDTFVTAVRTVVRSLGERSEREGLRVAVRRAETADELLARVASEAIDPAWAAEMLLEEAEAALASRRDDLAVPTEIAARDASVVVEELAAIERVPRSDDEPACAVSRPGQHAPVRPSPDVPTGFIWPAHTGRSLVRRIGLSGGTAAPVDGNGRVVFEAGGHMVLTSSHDCYEDAETARAALVRRARECAQLNELLVPGTVLVAVEGTRGEAWLWTIRPSLPGLEAALQQGEPAALVRGYATATARLLRFGLHEGLRWDLRPSSFAVDGGELRYVGEIVAGPALGVDVASTIAALTADLERLGVDVAEFLALLDVELRRQLTPEERAGALSARMLDDAP